MSYLSAVFSNRLLSRHRVCCPEWDACKSACLSFGSPPKRVPTKMGFELTHGNCIGLAVQRLNHWATLSLFIDKSQKIAVFSGFLFLCITKFVQHLPIRVCSHLSVVFWHFFWTRCFLDSEFVASNEVLVFQRVQVFGPCAKCIPQSWGFRIHARRSYQSSSPTNKAPGDTRHFLKKNQNNAVYSALVFFLVFPDISNIPNELECFHLCELFIRSFFEPVVI